MALTAQQIEAYFAVHPGATQAAAAKHFGCSDRYIRKLRSTAAAPVAPGRPALRVVGRPDVAVSRVTAAQFAPVPNTRGNGRTFWRCPVCDDFVCSPAGLDRHAWEDAQKRLHSHVTPAPAISDCRSSGSLPPEPEQTAPQAAGSAVPLVVPVQARNSVPVSRVNRIAQPSLGQMVGGWLVLYWRFVLGVVVGIVLLVYLS